MNKVISNFTNLFRSFKILSQTSFNIVDSRRRVGGGDTFVVKICGQVWLEEQGKYVEMFSVTTIWFGVTCGES